MILFFSSFITSSNNGGSLASRKLLNHISTIYPSIYTPSKLTDNIYCLYLILFSNKVSIIVIDGLFGIRLLLILFAKLARPNLRLIIHPRGNAIHYQEFKISNPHIFSNFSPYYFYLKLSCFLINLHDASFIASSTYEYILLVSCKLSYKNITIIHDDLPEPSDVQFSPSTHISTNYSIPTRILNIGYFGGNSSVKNLPFVVSLYNHFNISQSSCWLFGGFENFPSELYDMPTYKHKNYQLIGKTVHADISSYLSTCDVILIPSLSESFCYLAYEALLNDCYVLISDQSPWNYTKYSTLGSSLPLVPSLWTSCLQEFYSSPLFKSSLFYDHKALMLEEIHNKHDPDKIMVSLNHLFTLN